MVDGAIILDSVEELKLDLVGGDKCLEKFIEQLLSMCSAAKLKSVEIKRLSDKAYKKIRVMHVSSG